MAEKIESLASLNRERIKSIEKNIDDLNLEERLEKEGLNLEEILNSLRNDNISPEVLEILRNLGEQIKEEKNKENYN